MPINIGQLGGNVERSYSVHCDSVEYAFSITDPHVDISPLVTTYRQALASPERESWIVAMQKELKSIILDNKAVKVPDRRLDLKSKPLQNRWIFNKKFQPNGKYKFKARLVIKN